LPDDTGQISPQIDDGHGYCLCKKTSKNSGGFMRFFHFFSAISLCFSDAAMAAEPDWSRTIAWPFLGNEFSTVPPGGGCKVEAGCFRVENWTGYWLSPGLPQVAGAGSGQAPVVDRNGIVMGVYVGEYRQTGWYYDAQLGQIPAIDGSFRPAIGPQGSAYSNRVYLTVDPGVTEITADAIQFRSEGLPMGYAFDTGFQRVVSYLPGTGTIVKRCKVYNDVTKASGSPELAAITSTDCR
jgi:hypothetical protein